MPSYAFSGLELEERLKDIRYSIRLTFIYFLCFLLNEESLVPSCAMSRLRVAGMGFP